MKEPLPSLPMTPGEPTRPPPASVRDEDSEVTHALTAGPDSSAPGADFAPPARPPGRRFQHYEVCVREDGVTLHELGRGAMGVSYKARDVNLDTFVAIKVIRAGLPGVVQARERFRREARAAAQLRHPNVASVFHFGETPAPASECFYAMEFIAGETLAERVKRDGPLPAAQVLEIGLQVGAALTAADERGLVHRDLKPANLMLVAPASSTRTGTSAATSAAAAPVQVKVIDFGLAKAVAGSATGIDLEAPLTQVGGFFGTPAYSSPEQAEGAAVDARSDIYSLGATLWFALTGRVPFAGSTLGEIHDRQLHRPLPLALLREAKVPAPLVDLLAAMLASSPARRPASPADLLELMRECREGINPGAGSGRGRRSSSFPSPAAAGAPVRKVLAMAGALLGVLLLAGAGTLFWQRQQPASGASANAAPATPDLDKSIAVLPLEELSADGANDPFFADGIQDDLLNNLARIKELKVISRSSVMGYRHAANRKLSDIGQSLGVAHVIEGSVRRSGSRVLVNVALIDTRDGRQVWTERYDRTLEDSLTLQGQLATEIAAALRANLSPEEKTRVEARPTVNADAYVLYLRARDYQTRPNTLLQDYQTAEHLYGQAIALDPGFVLAHARRSAALAYTFENFRPTAEIHDQARAEADTALRLQPDSGEAHVALALCLYWTEKDYAGALRELEVAARLLPGSAEINRYTGAIRRRQGNWTGAVESMRQALVRDPRNAQTARELMRTDCLMRDWPAAARDGERAVAIAPDNLLLQFEKCSIDFWSRGDLAPLRGVLAAVPPGMDPDGVITFTRWEVALVARDFAAAEQAVESSGLETFVTQFGVMLPKSYFLGCIALARGDAARAGPLLEAACVVTEAQARKLPQDPFRQARLGVLYAYLGRKEEAIRQGRRAVELVPETKDTYLGPSASALLALIYARTGETDQAVTLLTRLLQTPGGLVPGLDANITQNDLRRRWQWDPLRADPRFQALVAGPEPKTLTR